LSRKAGCLTVLKYKINNRVAIKAPSVTVGFLRMEKMKNSKAFTLIELLVVIAIIALLLAILIPSLSKAKELANRIVCGNHLKTLASASATYAAAQGGYFVPAGYSPYFFDPANPGKPLPLATAKTKSCTWMGNKTFREYINIDAYRPMIDWGQNDVPDEFLCPSDKISDNPDNVPIDDGVVTGVLTSYAYNVTDWKPWGTGSGDGWRATNVSIRIVGHRADAVKEPAGKLQFIDGIDWWTDWPAADYRIGWDKLGQATNTAYRDGTINPKVYGPVFYRHSEGAVIGFYDGHAEYMKKEKIFIVEDWQSRPKIAGMWTSSGYAPLY